MDKETPTPYDEIQTKLINLEIETKQIRKKMSRNILIIVTLTILSILGYSYSGYSLFSLFAILIGLLGGIYIVLGAIPTIYQPLSHEDLAFKRIAKATELIRKCKGSILALTEASKYVRSAYETLEDVSLYDLEWYEDINIVFKQFINNLKLLVPMIIKGEIGSEDLEKIALALSSRNSSKLEAAFSKVHLSEMLTIDGEPNFRIEQLANFLKANRILADALFVIVVISGCFVFYYLVTVYMDIMKEYVFGSSVAIFIGLLTIYYTKRKGTH